MRVADAKSSSRVPCKVGLWAANEAFNASTHSIYAGTPTRAAGANVAKLLLKTAPAEVPAYLAALDALCVHLELLTVLRAREKELPVSAVATPFRGLTDGKPTHYVVELVDGRYALLGKQGARWQLHVGKRQEVLATVPDTLFAAAVAAVGEGLAAPLAPAGGRIDLGGAVDLVRLEVGAVHAHARGIDRVDAKLGRRSALPHRDGGPPPEERAQHHAKQRVLVPGEHEEPRERAEHDHGDQASEAEHAADHHGHEHPPEPPQQPQEAARALDHRVLVVLDGRGPRRARGHGRGRGRWRYRHGRPLLEGRRDRGRAPVRVGLQHALEGLDQGLAHAPLQEAAHVEPETLVGKRVGLGAGERGDHGGADRVDVGGGEGAPLQLLGGHVAHGADHGARAAPRHELGDRAEVDEDVGPVGPAHDVAGLDVAVDDGGRAAVQVSGGAVGACEEAPHLVLGERALAAADLVEGLALDLLHHEVERVVLLEAVEVLGDQRVIEGREHAGLALGELHVLPAARAADVEPLDGDAALLALVEGVVGGALRALSEGAPDDVTFSEPGPRFHGGLA